MLYHTKRALRVVHGDPSGPMDYLLCVLAIFANTVIPHMSMAWYDARRCSYEQMGVMNAQINICICTHGNVNISRPAWCGNVIPIFLEVRCTRHYYYVYLQDWRNEWMRTASYHILNDVILTPLWRQSAESASILLHLVPRASERMFFPPAFKNFRHVIKRRNIDVDATPKRASASILLRLVPRAKELMFVTPKVSKNFITCYQTT